ncbi:hypothetical protein GPJ56_010825 [Histomonas meleagridis]|uniref:uncharacterized protein n=1 Tax=Histomonas meleagridis TaxID=135588 RepID=UPI00355A700D|nr:hypothetical protein GPJ56_010825 [Histomonas meleagridis]KAH0803753.1 hypothetical protein GO595_003527 [Histomonas meleagridis]
MMRKIHSNAVLDKITEINGNNDFSDPGEDLKKAIVVNVEKQMAIERNKQLEEARAKRSELSKQLAETEAAANYYMTPESVALQNKIVEEEKQTIMEDKKTEELKNSLKVKEELWKSSVAQQKAQYMLDNNDASIVSQVKYMEEQLTEARNNLASHAEALQLVKASINE